VFARQLRRYVAHTRCAQHSGMPAWEHQLVVQCRTVAQSPALALMYDCQHHLTCAMQPDALAPVPSIQPATCGAQVAHAVPQATQCQRQPSTSLPLPRKAAPAASLPAIPPTPRPARRARRTSGSSCWSAPAGATRTPSPPGTSASAAAPAAGGDPRPARSRVGATRPHGRQHGPPGPRGWGRCCCWGRQSASSWAGSGSCSAPPRPRLPGSTARCRRAAARGPGDAASSPRRPAPRAARTALLGGGLPPSCMHHPAWVVACPLVATCGAPSGLAPCAARSA
jgi:hypothetical protein